MYRFLPRIWCVEKVIPHIIWKLKLRDLVHEQCINKSSIGFNPKFKGRDVREMGLELQTTVFIITVLLYKHIIKTCTKV